MARYLNTRNLRRSTVWLLVAAATAAFSFEQAQAQRPGGQRPGGQRGEGQRGGGRLGMLNSPGINQLTMLRNESVQNELKLSGDQKAKVATLGDEVQSEFQAAFTELGELDPEDRREKMQELQQKALERGKGVQRDLAGILSPEQTTRLKQISLQRRGVSALTDDEVAAELKLTDDQKKQLASLQTQNETEMRDAFRQAREAGAGDRDAMRAKMESLREAANARLLGVLTADQKTQWEQMQGPKADIRFEGPMGGGGGRQRRPQGA